MWVDATELYVSDKPWFTRDGPWQLVEIRQDCRKMRVVFRLDYKNPGGETNWVEETIRHSSDYWFVGASQWVSDVGLQFWTQWEQKNEAHAVGDPTRWVDYTEQGDGNTSGMAQGNADTSGMMQDGGDTSRIADEDEISDIDTKAPPPAASTPIVETAGQSSNAPRTPPTAVYTFEAPATPYSALEDTDAALLAGIKKISLRSKPY